MHATSTDRPTKLRIGMFCSKPDTGRNLLRIQLRTDTVEHYLRAAAQLFTERKMENPLDYKDGKDYTNTVISALRKYEEVPNRREPITDEMFYFMEEKTSDFKKGSKKLYPSVFDWLVLGRYTGFRKQEWCQENKTKYNVKEDHPDQPATALIADDMVFLDKEGRLLDPTRGRHQDPFRMDLKWRFQKNGENGQSITYYRDLKKPKWCPVLAGWNIRQ